MNQHKHTSGPACVVRRHSCHAIVDDRGNDLLYIDMEPRFHNGEPCGSVTSRGRTREELEANANLIAEAFTVAHETGRTPRQLADERAALIEALRALSEFVDSVRPGGPVLRGEAEIMDNAAAILARCATDTPT